MAGTGQTKGSGLDTNIASLLCYSLSWITGIVFLVLDKDNKEVKFNAIQSILLSIPWIIFYIIMQILDYGTLWRIISTLNWLIWAGTAVVSILCMIKAYQNERFKIPVIGDIAEQQANK